MSKLRTPLEQQIAVIGVASALGSPDPDCARGPEALARGLGDALKAAGRESAWRILRPAESDIGSDTERLGELTGRLAAAVEDSMRRGEFPLILSGDHSCAIGAWRGVARSCASLGPLGLLWIDAHLDSHTPATSHSGQLHGMPLAALLGHGAECLAGGHAVLDPRNVAVVGVRSYEPEEFALLHRLGVRIYEMKEIEQRGLGPVIEEALQIVRRHSAAWGITIDLDSIDPADAPGVSVPEKGGIRGRTLLRALEGAARLPGLAAVEIAEFNPAHDSRGKTAGLVGRLARTLLPAGKAGTPEGPDKWIDMERRFGAHNYHPLPVVLTRGQGVYLWDEAGRRYLDMMSAYSAVSVGHAHPRLLRALTEQAATLAVTSRAYHNTRLPLLLRRLCELTGLDQALPMNTGAEAVETALKAARKWAYQVKRIPPERAGIIACEGNFHGRSITIVGMSSERQYKEGFGPFPAGFTRVPYGDAGALAQAITPDTAAFLVEPVQGEGGIIVPSRGYLTECARICRERNVLLICDEVQTGLGRTGRLFACEHENVLPDGIILGKALGGGLLPVSAFVGRREVMQVFSPGDHGSTFGGNPLAAAVALEALNVILDERLAERAETLGRHFLGRLRTLRSRAIRDVRGAGLLIGLELDPLVVDARTVCERLLERGILSKDTHHTVVRFAPPLTIEKAQLDWAIDQLQGLFDEIDEGLLQHSESDLVN